MRHPHRACGGSGAAREHERGSLESMAEGSYFQMRKCAEREKSVQTARVPVLRLTRRGRPAPEPGRVCALYAGAWWGLKESNYGITERAHTPRTCSLGRAANQMGATACCFYTKPQLHVDNVRSAHAHACDVMGMRRERGGFKPPHQPPHRPPPPRPRCHSACPSSSPDRRSFSRSSRPP